MARDMRQARPGRPDYGVDAPGVVLGMAAGGLCALAAGVASRILFTARPFREGSFHAVVSSFAVHNIASEDGRRAAVLEMARVLKPGGRIALLDIVHGAAYARALRAHGLADVRVSPPKLVFVIPSRLVTARKPAG